MKRILLIILISETASAISDCNYYTKIDVVANQSHFLVASYNPGKSCRWHAESEKGTQIVLACENDPSSSVLNSDCFAVYHAGELDWSDVHHFCGPGMFVIESIANQMDIAVLTLDGSEGGAFACQLTVKGAPPGTITALSETDAEKLLNSAEDDFETENNSDNGSNIPGFEDIDNQLLDISTEDTTTAKDESDFLTESPTTIPTPKFEGVTFNFSAIFTTPKNEPDKFTFAPISTKPNNDSHQDKFTFTPVSSTTKDDSKNTKFTFTPVSTTSKNNFQVSKFTFTPVSTTPKDEIENDGFSQSESPTIAPPNEPELDLNNFEAPTVGGTNNFGNRKTTTPPPTLFMPDPTTKAPAEERPTIYEEPEEPPEDPFYGPQVPLTHEYQPDNVTEPTSGADGIYNFESHGTTTLPPPFYPQNADSNMPVDGSSTVSEQPEEPYYYGPQNPTTPEYKPANVTEGTIEVHPQPPISPSFEVIPAVNFEVGYADVYVNGFPLMGALVDGAVEAILCAAAIISEFSALSSAHCLIFRDPTQVGFFVNNHGRDYGNDPLLGVDKIFVHPQYNPYSRCNDIALIRIKQPIQFGHNLAPAFLPMKYSSQTFDGDNVVSVGWMPTSFSGVGLYPMTLQAVPQRVMNPERCRQMYGGHVNYNQLCTYEISQYPCPGNFGGPLFWSNGRRHHVIGISSFGHGPGVYAPHVNTRVTEYLPWIMTNANEREFFII